MPLEMLFVNLFVIHKCCQRKYSRIRTFVSMALFVCALLYIEFIISSFIPNLGDGNGLFIISGFLFFIPIKILYKTPNVKVITIACFSLVYTFVLFALSVRLSYAITIPGWHLRDTALLAQTLLYIATFNTFFSLLKSRFIVVLKSNGKKEAFAFMWMTMVWFCTVFILNLTFSYPNMTLLKIIALPVLAACILCSFRYIYLHVSVSEAIQNLESVVFRDELTQLRTRVILCKDAEDLISRKMPFHLIFLDLDFFKSINDRYGHLVGDQYLAFFAYEVKIRIGNRGGFYRVAGDEFVCILPEEERLDDFLDDITMLPDTMPDSQVKFLGFSYGIATFPRDGTAIETLLAHADRNMYEMKRAIKYRYQ
jgi:diguanylate cyclase (GGDEF)-like protein